MKPEQFCRLTNSTASQPINLLKHTDVMQLDDMTKNTSKEHTFSCEVVVEKIFPENCEIKKHVNEVPLPTGFILQNVRYLSIRGLYVSSTELQLVVNFRIEENCISQFLSNTIFPVKYFFCTIMLGEILLEICTHCRLCSLL